ncbi:ABC transporter [Actinoplanes sp. SE50]|uniref:ABC transporter permease n=1 Tax=unclassified Actinoplanes TaxID=2626549 RepID=UPI00023EC8A5|nr:MULTISPECIES: ABC transporter permease [unclassified Actinoplanes]AEV81462.1 O-antigen export system permease protein rfbA [Actinoplanes sp. SE50/110]ATO79865.1 ABC transporter [Actinoplanes sp. SE50]SLL97267.1 ABC transporter [Actinoplanes sp. SE50/110]
MPETAVADAATGIPLKELARRHGLSSSGRLLGPLEYARQVWGYRYFITAHAKAKTVSTLGTTNLGTLWQVLTPAINALVYYVIFGVIIGTGANNPNFIPYLCIGVFVFGFTQSTVSQGVNSITGNLGLIRALHFPRASLPLSAALVEIRNFITATGVLLIIVLLCHEPITVQWLLIFPVMLLQSLFNFGLAMGGARLGSTFRDIKQLVPFIMRFWMYGSAVLYPVTRFTHAHALQGWKLHLIEANPMLVFVELYRHSLMEGQELVGTPKMLWIEGVIWAVVVGTAGFLYFWRGEKGYGRG